MIRWFDAALVGMMVATASVTFWIKHDSRRIASEIAALERQIGAEQTTMELQNAEWSLLTQPDRLQVLVEEHGEDLGLRPAEAEQFVTLKELEAVLDDAAPVSIEDAIAGQIGGDDLDALLTGAIE